MEHRPVPLRRTARRVERETAESRFWKSFRSPVYPKQFGSVTHLHFSPVAPHDLAVTSMSRVSLINGRTRAPVRALSRFTSVAYSGSYRSDGKLLVAGGRTPVVQVFDLSSRAVLRSFDGHTGEVHATAFATDKMHVMSGSDDKSLRFWDVPTATCELTLRDAHDDYVRTLAHSPATPQLWASGSYDHTAALWDVRTLSSGSQAAALRVEHGSPIESVLIAAGLLFTAGGNTVKLWDILSGGRLMATLENHQKTVTSLCMDGEGKRLITASLDAHIKVIDTTELQVVAGLKAAGPIMSLAVSPDNRLLAVGQADGTLCIKERVRRTSALAAIGSGGADADGDDSRYDDGKQRLRPKPGSRRYFGRGSNKRKPAAGVAIVAPAPRSSRRRKRLKPWDQFIKAFRYKKALDAALESKIPAVVFSVLRELLLRDGLSIALSGRSDAQLEPVLAFLVRYCTRPEYSGLLLRVASSVTSLYARVVGRSKAVDALFLSLKARVDEEIAAQQQLMQLIGQLDLLVSASSTMAAASSKGSGEAEEEEE
eukprot:PLAT8452.3.p1 GENE.PLAT8452.3~~PLAT8452.3.p1  ORF type:complete len:540 (+),score=230.78 PLAT8452.3:21-1640(+)